MKTLYPIAYRLDHKKEGFTREFLEEHGLGGCDAMLIFSIIRENKTCEPHVGSKSIGILSMDGRNGEEIPMTEMFQVFSHLAKYISENAIKDSFSHQLTSAAFEGIREWHMAGRPE